MLFVFILISIANLIAVAFDIYWLELCSKPLIIPSLIALLITKTKETQSLPKMKLIAALLFSFLGDVLLLFVSKNSLFFILGLASFLIAHIFYIIVFQDFIRRSERKFDFNLLFLVVILIYIGLFLGILIPKLNDELVFPIICYSITIACMLFVASGLKAIMGPKQYKFILIGACLFVFSDSLIAVNKFVVTFDLAHFLIMLTYITAQYLFVKACIPAIGEMKTLSETKA